MYRNKVAGLGRDAAGNLYLAGHYVGAPTFDGVIAPNAGETDGFLAKYSPAGNLLWLRTIQGTGEDLATSLAVSVNGHCTVVGQFGGRSGGDLSFPGAASTTTLPGPAALGLPPVGTVYPGLPFVATFDETGRLLWATMASPTPGLALDAVQRDANGNCYLSATAQPQSALIVNGQTYPPLGSYDAVLIKYSAAGQPTMVRRVGTPGGFTTSGGLQIDNANAVYWLVSHTSPIVLDQTTVSVPAAPGANSIIKLTANNRLLWARNSLLRNGSADVLAGLLHLDAGSSALYLSCGSGGGTISFGTNGSLALPSNTYTGCVARCDTAGQVQWVNPVIFATNVPGNWQGPLEAAVRNVVPDATGYTVLTHTARSGSTTFNGLG